MNTPKFFDSKDILKIRRPRTLLVSEEASKVKCKPSSEDKDNKVALFSIDSQITFCHPEGGLYVPGAEQDVIKTCEFIYKNIDKITSLHFSLDTHLMYQIFFPSFWTNTETGTYPDPYTIITLEEINSGKYVPNMLPHECRSYVEELEKTGKYSLMIWPYHAEVGTIDHALMPMLFEAAVFHSLVRKKQYNLESKGNHPLTENYSVLSPEVKKVKNMVVGQFNTKFFKTLMDHDKVYICGEASSHCVLSTIEDLLREIKDTDPTLVDKVYLLKDCMSPVPAVKDGDGNVLVDFPKIAEDALKRFEAEGMHVVNSTDGIKL